MKAQGLFEKSIYGNGNRMVFSRFNQFELYHAPKSHVSIKYVIDGTELYELNRKDFRVNSGEYLLINSNQSYNGFINAQKDVLGICMNIDTSIIMDVYKTLKSKTSQILDDPISALKDPIDVYEKIYSGGNCPLGKSLQDLSKNLLSSDQLDIENFELYFSFAEKLLESQGLIQKKICQVKAERYVTQKELYKRVQHGRMIIDENYCSHLKIEDLATASFMSPFHFSRTFKQVFNLSPYQYIIRKRLEKSEEYLKNNHYSISEIAFLTGFADVQSFSKSFKSAHRISPRSFKLVK